MGHIPLLTIVVLFEYCDASMSRLDLAVSQVGSAEQEKGFPWTGIVAMAEVDREIYVG